MAEQFLGSVPGSGGVLLQHLPVSHDRPAGAGDGFRADRRRRHAQPEMPRSATQNRPGPPCVWILYQPCEKHYRMAQVIWKRYPSSHAVHLNRCVEAGRAEIQGRVFSWVSASISTARAFTDHVDWEMSHTRAPLRLVGSRLAACHVT